MGNLSWNENIYEGYRIAYSSCLSVCQEGFAHLGRVVTRVKGLQKCNRLFIKSVDFFSYISPCTLPIPLGGFYSQIKNFSKIMKSIKIIDDIHAWICPKDSLSQTKNAPFWQIPKTSYLKVLGKFFDTGCDLCITLEFLDTNQLISLGRLALSAGRIPVLSTLLIVPFGVVKDTCDLLGSLFALAGNLIKVINSLRNGEIIDIKFNRLNKKNQLLQNVLEENNENDLARQNLLEIYKTKITEGNLHLHLLALKSKLPSRSLEKKRLHQRIDLSQSLPFMNHGIDDLEAKARSIQEQTEAMIREKWDIDASKQQIRIWEEEVWKFMESFEEFREVSKSMVFDKDLDDKKRALVAYTLSVLEKTNQQLDLLQRKQKYEEMEPSAISSHEFDRFNQKLKQWEDVCKAISEPSNPAYKENVKKIYSGKISKFQEEKVKIQKDRKQLQLNAAYRIGKIVMSLMRLGLLIGAGGGVYTGAMFVLSIGTYAIDLYKYLNAAKKDEMDRKRLIEAYV